MPVSEGHPTPTNRLGLDGLEFIEFTTSQPLVLGALLEKMGFRPVARHRSREVLLYRQGRMNLVVNAHPGAVRVDATGQPVTALGAMALRVADAGDAHRRTIELGAWDVNNVFTPILMSATPLSYERPAPRLGEHTEEILSELERAPR